jgi:predicted nucleic acid-binding protein
MPTFFDTSAVVALHVDTRERAVALGAVTAAATSNACVSALSLTEALAVIGKLTDERALQRDLEDALRLQWDRYAVVPVDQRCLDRASELLREQPIRLADAIHLAAADRLPRPVRYVTFDPVQIPVALGLGFDVVSLESPHRGEGAPEQASR